MVLRVRYSWLQVTLIYLNIIYIYYIELCSFFDFFVTQDKGEIILIKIIGANSGTVFKIVSDKSEAFRWINHEYPSLERKNVRGGHSGQAVKYYKKNQVLPEPLSLVKED